jgi:predicted phosphodiesterase
MDKLIQKIIFFIVVFHCPGLFSFTPQSAFLSDDDDRIFWFLIISDTHIGENFSGGDQDTKNLAWALTEAYNAIKPAFVVNCGDLTDSTNGGLIPDGPHKEEWEAYINSVKSNGMNPSIYFDLPGNHDQYNDKELKFYKQYSLQGSNAGMTQFAWTLEFSFGKYLFVGVATCGNDGLPWPADNVSIDAGEMDFIVNAFESNADASLGFVLGHHPIANFTQGLVDFRNLLENSKASAYIYGHTHDFLEKFQYGFQNFNIRSLGKSKDRNVGIVAVDGNGVSLKAFNVKDWPYVLITAPVDSALGEGNPYSYPVAKNSADNPLRVLVFSPYAVEKVEFSLDEGNWTSMNQITDQLWKSTFDCTGMKEGDHKATVRAKSNGKEKDDAIHFTVKNTACSNGTDDDSDGLTDFPYDPGCLSKSDDDEFNEIIIAEEAMNEDLPESPAEPEIIMDAAEMNETVAEIPAEETEFPAQDENADTFQEQSEVELMSETSGYDMPSGEMDDLISEDAFQEIPENENPELDTSGKIHITSAGEKSGCSCRMHDNVSFQFSYLILLVLLFIHKITLRFFKKFLC